VQPCFRPSDRKFGARDSLRSAAIATDRSANERAVKYSKNSDYVSSGLKPNQSAKRLDTAWMVWGFQCNFLYKPRVLEEKLENYYNKDIMFVTIVCLVNVPFVLVSSIRINTSLIKSIIINNGTTSINTSWGQFCHVDDVR
jgi:hypothetical protein